MGMHIGLIAIKASVPKFREALAQACPQLEVVSAADNLPNLEAIWNWKEAHEKVVTAADWNPDNPGKIVYLFWPNDPWSILIDEEYVLASDEQVLKTLSHQVGQVLSFVVESAGGTACFSCFQDGKLLRSVTNADGDLRLEGTPLPEEHNINMADYYMEETEALWEAFGLKPYEVMQSATGCEAICVVDHTDYSELLK